MEIGVEEHRTRELLQHRRRHLHQSCAGTRRSRLFVSLSSSTDLSLVRMAIKTI
jgi:hypothetical protein